MIMLIMIMLIVPLVLVLPISMVVPAKLQQSAAPLSLGQAKGTVERAGLFGRGKADVSD